jgi:hypothetical protein
MSRLTNNTEIEGSLLMLLDAESERHLPSSLTNNRYFIHDVTKEVDGASYVII